MKKIYILLTTLLIMFGVTGCSTAEPTTSIQTGTPSSFSPTESVEQSDTPSSPASFEYAESTLGNFSIAIASDNLLDGYISFYEYVNDEDGDRLIIRTDTKMNDFAFISIKHDDTGDKPNYIAGDTLFSVDELSPGKPFVVKLLIPGSLPAYGISFLDENDVKRFFSIQLSGRGIEEAPPYFFLEFENGGGLLPASPDL